MHHGARNLGAHFRSTDPAHIRRFVLAGAEGRRNAPKCQAIAKITGRRCQRAVRPDCPYCFNHSRGAYAVTANNAFLAESLKVLSSTATGRNRERALRTVRRIARGEIYALWRLDPRQPALDLLTLEDQNEQAVHRWLIDQHGIDLNKPLPGSDKHATPRCRDRLRYAAWRVLSRGDAVSPDFITKAGYRVINALRDDRKFWDKLAAIDAAAEAGAQTP